MDYKEIIKSFIRHQEAAGFKLAYVRDGDHYRSMPKTAEQAAYNVCACEEGWIAFHKDNWIISAYVLLGNEAIATVADASWKSAMPKSILADFDTAWEKHTEEVSRGYGDE